MTNPWLGAALAVSASLLAGCYTTRIHSGRPGVSPAPLATERWHHTVVGGMAELSDPVDLEAVCQGGAWGEIKEEYSFLNGLVAAITSGLYTPRTYTVMCATGDPAGPPPVGRRSRSL